MTRNHAAATAAREREAVKAGLPVSSFKTNLHDALKCSNHVFIHSTFGLIELRGDPTEDGTKGKIKAITFYKEETNGEYIELKGLVNIVQDIEVCESSGTAIVNFITLTVKSSFAYDASLRVNHDVNETIAFANKTITPLRQKDVR